MSAPVLELSGLVVRHRGADRAVLDGLALELAPGEVLAVVGESGSGKSTLLRALARLIPSEAGRMLFRGSRAVDWLALPARELRPLRRELQIVFQDPYASLDPRQRAGSMLREVLEVHALARGSAARARAAELLAEVGLPAEVEQRFPHALSGGERQRLAIARALAPGPRVLLLDEPVSALDPSHRAQVLNLLEDERARRGLAYLLVTHDLALARVLADRVAVLDQGRVVECGPARELLADPRHPATRRLVEAAPY